MVKDCEGFTFNIIDSSCILATNLTSTDLTVLNVSGKEKYLAVTGYSNCNPPYDLEFPEIKINNKLTDVRRVCQFTDKPFFDKKLNNGCMNLCLKLNIPLASLLYKMTSFNSQYLAAHRSSKIRSKRSLPVIGLNILKALSFASKTPGESILTDISTLFSPTAVLTKLVDNLKNGFNQAK